MPTYEYKREDGTTFEMWQNINDDPLETCPETGQKVKRLISGGTGLVFKGSGFYITDYKKQNSSGNNGNGQSNASANSSGNSSNQSNSGSDSNGTSQKANKQADSKSGSGNS